MSARVVCLTNIFDQQYLDVRKEAVPRCLSSPKRRDLFRCLQLATGREIVILSSPPKALSRRSPRWLSPIETRFSTYEQSFCSLWDVPKLRVPLAWVSFAVHVLRHTRSGDIVVLDNYELLYVIAAIATRIRRKVTFVLDFEDGKHAIDRSWMRGFSALAEALGRRMISGAMLAHPALRHRLPAGVQYEIVPGFIQSEQEARELPVCGPLRLVYSGSLDQTRGVDLLMSAMDHLPSDFAWELDISGAGPLEEDVRRFAAQERYRAKVRFHGSLSSEPNEALLRSCHVGLNCQRTSDPISDVTFPSKIFSYLSCGLDVLSSRASEVGDVCGPACSYYEQETPLSLATAIQALPCLNVPEQRTALNVLREKYSIEGTAERLRLLLVRTKLL